ncbi:hypothetical protein RJ639_040180 [Escallonia herrerae]|uniref:Isopentenyl phosphate kinase n=1 Tax=Escallonia herrerae TaxID=1293975 RepID=A0AA88WHV4_9ASTE|nr:hypothetical protein RJ639_040180 [Escallonia herrerae]
MEEEMNPAEQHSATTVNLSRPVRCIVKLGGAAITCKNEFEKINEESLQTVSLQLRQAMTGGGSSRKFLGMDWSKRPGIFEAPCVGDDTGDQLDLDSGSFGHFQASKSGVHKGGLNQPFVKAGFVATRISVTSLNHEIVRALAREGIPTIGMSPFSCGWSTCKRNIAFADVSMVAKAIGSGFVPVLHGDAVLDNSQDCTILSGDVITRHLAAELKPEFVVFLVSTVHPEISVREDGSWSVVKPALQDMNKQGCSVSPKLHVHILILENKNLIRILSSTVEITIAAHDTTGGMVTKISEAAMIAKLGIDVYIVKFRPLILKRWTEQAATDHSLRALSGNLKVDMPEDWLGTVVRFVR